MNLNLRSNNLIAAIAFAIPFLNIETLMAEPAKSLDRCEQSLTIEEFKAFALNNSPMVSEIDQKYAVELKTAFDTQVLQNPEIQFEQVYTNENLNGGNDSQTNASIAQPIKLSNFVQEVDFQRQ